MPIAASAISAMCSCRRATARLSPGRRTHLRAIARPSSTDSEISASATIPDARLISHQMSAAGDAHRARPPRTGLRQPSRPGDRADQLDVAVVVDDQPAVLGEHLARALRTAAAARSSTASRPRARCRRAPSRRSARSRPADRWLDRAGGGAKPLGVRHIRTFRPDVATPPRETAIVPIDSPVSGCSTSISYGRAAPRRRRPRCRRRNRRRTASSPTAGTRRCRRQPLADAAGVDAHARRAA